MNKEFRWLDQCAPCFNVNGDDIEVLVSPEEFYERLLNGSKTAKKRVVLAALYLGTDECEQGLVDALSESIKNEDLKVDILLDYVRGSRGEHNSRTMLLPILQHNTNVSLYHTPMLRGILKKILPNRWNEVVGVAHLKVFIFDDTLILSGANLSNDYFKNRQDRYMVFKNCSEISNYFHNIVTSVSKFSFKLKEDNTICLHDDWPNHPFDGNLHDFVEDAHYEIKEVILNAMNKGSNSHQSELLNSCWKLQSRYFISNLMAKSQNVCSYFYNMFVASDRTYESEPDFPITNDVKNRLRNLETINEHPSDTWIYPAIQMGNLGICQDQVITETLMKTFPAKSNIAFTSGYFNVTNTYCDLLLKTLPTYKILLASPEANGFLGARGFAGYIPAVYIYLTRQFFNRADASARLDKMSLWEYIRPGWTFHGKGLWCYLPEQKHPSLTLIGSPNFGSRSVTRDLEAQAIILTNNQNLKKQLHLEQENLAKFSQQITHDTFKQERYRVPRWVMFVTQLIRRYF